MGRRVASHRDIAIEANGALTAIIGGLSGRAPTLELVMAAEVIRGGLTELAIWWIDHPDVPVEAIVSTAMTTVWLGFERLTNGEAWRPTVLPGPGSCRRQRGATGVLGSA